MNHISVIQWVCGALAVIATLVGLGFFTRDCLPIANLFLLGAPVDRQRLDPHSPLASDGVLPDPVLYAGHRLCADF